MALAMDGGNSPGEPVVLDRHPDGSKEKPFHRKDSETLSLCLADMAMDVRYNLRSHRMEWRGVRLTDPDKWSPVTDRSLANIREGIARQYFVQTKEGPRAGQISSYVGFVVA